jgi:hypothetical protein
MAALYRSLPGGVKATGAAGDRRRGVRGTTRSGKPLAAP